MNRVVCIGECMVELSPAGHGLLACNFAGDVYNTAVYLKRSDPLAQVQFATVVGDDPFSAAMLQRWQAEGVSADLAWTAPGKRPGLYLIETDAAGERRFHYWRSESAARGWFAAMRNGGADLLVGADLVYLSGISLAILPPEDLPAALRLMRELRGRVGRVAFDPNYRPALWPSLETAREAMDEALAATDLALPSDQDMESLYGLCAPEKQMEILIERGVREAAITAGPGRCLVLHEGQAAWLDGVRASAVVDTSGAGDSFNGAYLAARLNGADPLTAAKAGLTLAAKVVGMRGAIVDPQEELN